jgi:hypothetical protein
MRVGSSAPGRASATPAAPPVAGLRREARLRPEHAGRYPGIEPGRWEPAAMLADRVLARSILRGSDLLHPGRILLDAHFEFRGGGRQTELGLEGARPRREDR